MKWTVEQALRHWQDEGLLTKQKSDELRDSLDRAEGHLPNRAIQIFAGVGAVLVGLGVILFVASNWERLTPVLKVGILLLGMLLSGAAGYSLQERGMYPKTGMALQLVNMLVFGASIFLVAQIYHLPLNFWLGTLLWLIGALWFAFALRSRWHLVLAIPLMLVTVGWLRASLLSGTSDEFGAVFDPAYGVTALLLLYGALLISAGILARIRSALHFTVDTLMSWGLFLIIIPLVISTIDREVFFPIFWLRADPVTVATAIVTLAAAGFAFLRAPFFTSNGKHALLALLVYIAFVYGIVRLPQMMGFPIAEGLYAHGGYLTMTAPMLKGLFALHIVLVFVVLLLIVWFGTLLKHPAAVNLGMLGIAFVILIQYFSWAFALLDRSIAFILGGLLILAVSSLLERKRRQLILSMQT